MKLSNHTNGLEIQEIKAGNHQAFRRFYDFYYSAIYRFTRYFLPEGEDCEEVVSEVFCIIWLNRMSLERIEHMESYLYTICRNECWRCLKQKEKYRHITSIDEMPVELSIHTESIEESLIEKELFDTYKKAVELLPERCKLIFLLVREEKMKHKDIARVLNITEGTVEQQMNIAIKKILALVSRLYPSLGRKSILKPRQSG